MINYDNDNKSNLSYYIYKIGTQQCKWFVGWRIYIKNGKNIKTPFWNKLPITFSKMASPCQTIETGFLKTYEEAKKFNSFKETVEIATLLMSLSKYNKNHVKIFAI